ncbi:AMP-binding protein [Congregicoccus parvus]|uniref:ANL family adenylate-forming protein n=1 Tax=Congregicoccus parvus TaxID=3081749 RepID=UPI003FA61241
MAFGVFVIDPVSDRRLTYEQLLVAMQARVYRPALRPTDMVEACVEVVRAMVFGLELTLFDSDFSAEECAQLGGTAEVLAEERPIVEAAPGTIGEMVERARAQRGLRLRLFTSGSTGLPKRVSHGLDSLTRMLRVSTRHAEDVWGFAYNPTHMAGVQVLVQAFFNGNAMVNLFGAERDVVLDASEAHGVTRLSATPSWYRLLLPVDRPLPRVRGVTLGGERADAALLGRLRAAFPQARLHNLYASTEAGALLASEGDLFRIPKELEARVRVRDGALEVHATLLGRFADGASESTSTDGWYRTGDAVEIVGEEEPLSFRIVGRARDWVNVGGSKVNPAEVEEALREFPGVIDARVTGRPNSVLGHVLQAEIEAEEETRGHPRPTSAELRAFLTGRLQPFKIPRLYAFVERIERTRTGKLQRAGAR